MKIYIPYKDNLLYDLQAYKTRVVPGHVGQRHSKGREEELKWRKY